PSPLFSLSFTFHRHHLHLHSFPTRRSSDLSAASALTPTGRACCLSQYCMTIAMLAAPQPSFSCFTNGTLSQMPEAPAASAKPQRDRKSTRLNSSHVAISYAVFCLKKKTQLE